MRSLILIIMWIMNHPVCNNCHYPPVCRSLEVTRAMADQYAAYQPPPGGAGGYAGYPGIDQAQAPPAAAGGYGGYAAAAPGPAMGGGGSYGSPPPGAGGPE